MEADTFQSSHNLNDVVISKNIQKSNDNDKKIEEDILAEIIDRKRKIFLMKTSTEILKCTNLNLQMKKTKSNTFFKDPCIPGKG